jgi:glycerophosphoryl diester phosphodiesterase
MNIEIKTTKSLDSDNEVYNFSNKLIDILHKYNIADDVIVQSFDTRALKYVKEIDHAIITSYLVEDELPNIDSLINTSKKLDVKIISPDYNLLDKQIVKKLQENGFEVLPWTVNDVNTLTKNIDYGVDGIITDYPKQMNDYLNDYLKKINM